jgi:uncharacterized membrane protein YhaH (DUF805 family)
MQWYLKVLRQYADFSGRARRTEYWMFTLVSIVISLVLLLIDSVVIGTPPGRGIGILGAIYTVAVLLPTLAVGARRLHDTDRSGWWQLIAIVPIVGTIILIVLFALEGNRDTNKYGPDPKQLAPVA